ncbi:restriction endonuclease subunit S, partial [Streptococcus gallolyticus]|uniref:restriction endonuclease subunit S n=1 Tax=Streptococcus gallolyticus TaxID=315405 RepID=UPI002284A83B
FRKEKESIIDKYLQGGQGNLSAQIIKKLEIPFPTFEEQNKIGRYFTELNRLITLHQRKDFGFKNVGILIETAISAEKSTLKVHFECLYDTLLRGGL